MPSFTAGENPGVLLVRSQGPFSFLILIRPTKSRLKTGPVAGIATSTPSVSLTMPALMHSTAS